MAQQRAVEPLMNEWKNLRIAYISKILLKLRVTI
jgi:hypothetical protein